MFSLAAIHLQAAGVPTVPGSDGLIKDEEEALRYAEQVTPDSQPKILCKVLAKIIFSILLFFVPLNFAYYCMIIQNLLLCAQKPKAMP